VFQDCVALFLIAIKLERFRSRRPSISADLGFSQLFAYHQSGKAFHSFKTARVSSSRGNGVPHVGRCVVKWNPFSLFVEVAQVSFRYSVSLLCRPASPLCGFRIVLGNSRATVIHEGKVVLSCGEALLCCRSKPTRR
jgi:hypothetical protein